MTIQRIKRRFLLTVVFIEMLCLSTGAFSQDPSQPPDTKDNHGAQQQQEQSPPQQRVQLTTKDMKKLIVKKVQPVYPEIARNARIVGRCGVRVVITPQGDLGEVHLVYGHPILAPAAIDAVKKWEFRPYLLRGHAVEAEGEVELSVP